MKSYALEPTRALSSFTAFGNVRCQFFDDEKLSVDFTNHFKIVFLNCKYAINVNGSRPNNDRLEGVSCVFDGIDSYTTSAYSTNPVTKILVKQGNQWVEREIEPVMSKNNSSLNIYSGPLPPTLDHVVSFIWLGLASQCFYKTNTMEFQKPPIFVSPAYFLHDIKLKTKWSMSANPPYFLERREDFHEGKVFTSKNSKLSFTTLTGALADGYTNSIFAVTEWKDASGLSYPKHMELQIFGVGASQKKIEMKRFFRASIESITPSVDTDSIELSVRPKTQIMDTRASVVGSEDKNGKSYFSDDGAVLTNASDIEAKRHEKRPQQKPLVFKRNPRQVLVLCTLVILGALPVFFFLVRKKNVEK